MKFKANDTIKVRLVANDMLDTTKSEDVLSCITPKTPFDTIVYDILDRVSYALRGNTRSDILRFCRIQHVVCDKLDRVS